jgi:hypothetical protein
MVGPIARAIAAGVVKDPQTRSAVVPDPGHRLLAACGELRDLSLLADPAGSAEEMLNRLATLTETPVPS